MSDPAVGGSRYVTVVAVASLALAAAFMLSQNACALERADPPEATPKPRRGINDDNAARTASPTRLVIPKTHSSPCAGELASFDADVPSDAKEGSTRSAIDDLASSEALGEDIGAVQRDRVPCSIMPTSTGESARPESHEPFVEGSEAPITYSSRNRDVASLRSVVSLATAIGAHEARPSRCSDISGRIGLLETGQ